MNDIRLILNPQNVVTLEDYKYKNIYTICKAI